MNAAMSKVNFYGDHWAINSVDGAFYLERVKNHPGGILAELGSHLGRSLSYVLPTCRSTGMTVYSVDLWQDAPGRFEQFLINLGEFDDYVRIIHMDSVQAAAKFHDGELEIIFVDTVHSYEHTKAEIAAWWPKLKQGGEMLFHDYGPSCGWPGVAKAVDECFARTVQPQGSLCLIIKGENNECLKP
jgi:predicted O-methyltransferase YrrM